jgi:hypothetical protein
MAKLYQVTLRLVKTQHDPKLFEPAFGRVGNWARLNTFSWYVWSNFTSEQIYNALRLSLQPDDSIAIFEVNPQTRMGWAPPWFWDWVATEGRTIPPKI